MLDEENDLKPAQDEEEQPEDDHSEEEDQEEQSEEETIEVKKADYDRLQLERENYKRGLLGLKAKPRSLSEEEVETKKAVKPVDASEDKIRSVLYRDNERRVLREVIDQDSEHYMKELVDDDQFAAIVGYLPRKVDRSSEASIRRALRTAISAWQFDRGIKKEMKVEKKPEADLAASSGRSGDGSSDRPKAPKKGERKILRPATKISEWYKV